MTWKCEDIQDRGLKAASDRKSFDIHLAALEWSLIDPIIINDEGDIKAVNWRDRGLKPFTHQIQNLITFCRRLPVALIADDVGLGKTISAGLIMSELITRRRVNRILIICPKVLMGQWVTELEDKFGLVAQEFTGKDLSSAFQGRTQIVVTTYQSASERLKEINDGLFDMCVLDEAHKLRNLYGPGKPPAMAENVKAALERRPFKFVLMLTATPIQNKIWDLYSLIELLKVAEGKTNPLGDPESFQSIYLQPGTGGRKLIPDRVRSFQNKVRDCLSRTRRGDIKLTFPQRSIQLFRVRLEGDELAMIQVVAKDIESLPELQQISLAQAMMSSPRALLSQVKNMVNRGSMQKETYDELKQHVDRVPIPAKLTYLIKLIDNLASRNRDSWRLVVFTVRLETQQMLKEFLTHHGIACGLIRGEDHKANKATIKAYQQEPPVVNVIVSTEAGSEGINLQAGNVIINYDLPWNPMLVEQRIGRVQRLGSSFKHVIIGNLVGEDTVEEKIVGRLTEKLQGINQAIGNIEDILEVANIDCDWDSNTSYEGRIRDMVVKSLIGENIEEAKDKLLKDITDAQINWEKQREFINTTLGGSSEESAKIKGTPKIERKLPRIPAKQFVLDAMQARGFQLNPIQENLYEATKKGLAPEKISFADSNQGSGQAIFTDQHIHKYLPGMLHFERLVQHWVDHHAHHVIEPVIDEKAIAAQLAQRWVARYPHLKLIQSTFRAIRLVFGGMVYLRVRAATGVDSFEKIMRGRIPPPQSHQPPKFKDTAKVISTDLSLGQMVSNYQTSIHTNVEKDEDLNKFCHFYLDRLNSSLKEAGTDIIKQKKVEGDFQPVVQAEIIGLEGSRYQEGTLDLKLEIDQHSYDLSIPVIPASEQILEEVAMGTCSLTKLNVPSICLATCDASGSKVLKHKLVRTENGAYLIPSELVTCAISGKQILKKDALQDPDGTYAHKSKYFPDDFTGELVRLDRGGRSIYSNKCGRRDRMVKSEISGRHVFPEETVQCKSTGRLVVIDEATRSEYSGQWYANDRLVTCNISGTKVPPDDVVQCQLTGTMGRRSLMGVCNVSKRLVRKDRLLTSAASKKQFCPEFGISLDDGRFALKDEVGECVWSKRMVLKKDIDNCELSGNSVDKKYLNEAKELKVLRDLLEEKLISYPLQPEKSQQVKANSDYSVWFRGYPTFYPGPNPKTYAIVVRETKWFGLQIKHYVGIMETMDGKEKLIGRVSAHQRKNGFWVRVG